MFLAVAVACTPARFAQGAVAVKKASPVATQSADATASVASLVPTVMSLVAGVQQLNAKQRELTQECIPSNAEISFVDGVVKEWAKTGAMSVADIQRQLGRKPCPGGTGYAFMVSQNAGTDLVEAPCFDNYATENDKLMVWYQFPKVGHTSYCADGTSGCKNKANASDIYEIFNLVDFTEADYTVAEATMAAKILSKIETCSTAKLSAKKKAMWGEFLTQTISNVAQPTNTGSIMQSVSGIAGGTGGLSSLGAIASQFMDR